MLICFENVEKEGIFHFVARKINNSNLCHRRAHVGIIFEDSVGQLPRDAIWYGKMMDKILYLRATKKSSDSKVAFSIAATCRRFLKLLKLLSQVEFMRSTLISEFWMTGNSWQRFQILLNSRWLICWRPWCQVVFDAYHWYHINSDLVCRLINRRSLKLKCFRQPDCSML